MFRLRVKCGKCHKSYITNKRRRRTAPTRCKKCGSIMLRVINYWRVK